MRQDAVGFHYRKGIGETMVYGPLFIAVVLALGGLSRGLPFLFWASPIALGFTLFHLPMIKKDHPPLIAEARGLYVSGLGLLPWSAIRAAAYRERRLRSLRIGQIVVSLVGAPDVSLTKADPAPFWRRWQTKVWQVEDRDLVLDLRSIEGDPMEVYQAIEDFRRG